MAIAVGSRSMSFFVISWIIIHFGAKPDNGGRPPSDNRVVRSIVVKIGVLFHISDRDSVVVVVELIKRANIVIVIIR